ncbi:MULTISPECIES: hypothetical protein [Aneurinibacillus]|jgi:hypothetical protein|uniref:Uncharacterized protein n=1 Tax=Aneurinibacillus danicus TaxID=267746 RepID=A0A511VER7_9BACL|nr:MULTISPECIES: hypothetical protein [Aneurinibacillus]GEN35772.1 hypothetical protein ADA01nite_32320 [Aneurinibacillus danicus]
MENKYICQCGMYTYHCECLPSTHSPYYDDLLHRLNHAQEAIIGEDDITTVLRLMPKGKETRLVLHPVQNGFYSAQFVRDSILHK